MKGLSFYAVGATIVLFAGVLTWTILRGEDTRHDVTVIKRTVDPCTHPKSVSCQRRIRLVLRELGRRHPGELRKLGLVRRDTGSKGVTAPLGGDAFGSPTSGGGPIGRVPSPGSPPDSDQPPPSSSEPDEPAVDLDVPLVPRVCVGDLLAVNC